MINVMCQVNAAGVKVNCFLVCDSGDAQHKYMHKLASWGGNCRGCKGPIYKNQIIIRHSVRKQLWVHAKCSKKGILAAPIVCYLCLKVCLENDVLTKTSNGGALSYRHANGCTPHPQNENIIDVEADALAEANAELVKKRGFSEAHADYDDGDLRNTDVMPCNLKMAKVDSCESPIKNTTSESPSTPDSPSDYY
jgi:hypothetical protein